MKYYKLDNQIFAFEADGSQDGFITPEMVAMTAAEVEAHLAPVEVPIEQTLPALTRRQFKLALLYAGLTAKIETEVEAITDPKLKAIINIEYNEGTEFRRTSDSVAYVQGLLGLNDAELNEIWESAAAR